MDGSPVWLNTQLVSEMGEMATERRLGRILAASPPSDDKLTKGSSTPPRSVRRFATDQRGQPGSREPPSNRSKLRSTPRAELYDDTLAAYASNDIFGPQGQDCMTAITDRSSAPPPAVRPF